MKSEELEIDDVKLGSPPSRAAWIEIKLKDSSDLEETVAAFTGGVD